MAEDSDLERTEPASQRRLDQAREDGHVPQSRELATFLVLMAAVVALWVSSRWMAGRMSELMRDGLSFGHAQAFQPDLMMTTLVRLCSKALESLAPFFVVVMIAAVAAPICMGGMVFTTKSFSIDLSRVNVFSGLKRVISLSGLAELVKGILKSALVGTVGYWVLWGHRDEILGLMSMPLEAGLGQFAHLLLLSSLLVVASLGVVAAADVPFQLWQYSDKMKMTKEELKQEFKEQEGDPQIKARIRARQREMAKRRMMEAVPKADVVVTNPTHYAVAIKYDAEAMGAPKVVAKGADYVAQAIRELALENHVPLLEAPPLARALYHHTKVDDQIPASLYTAVAEVMAYVYRLNHFLSQGGLPPETPHDLPVPVDLDPGPAVVTTAELT
jgi:flagellar biosynthesis protein FlhB